MGYRREPKGQPVDVGEALGAGACRRPRIMEIGTQVPEPPPQALSFPAMSIKHFCATTQVPMGEVGGAQAEDEAHGWDGDRLGLPGRRAEIERYGFHSSSAANPKNA